MVIANPKDPAGVKSMAALFNAMANLFWSVLNLFPIYAYCYSYVQPLWLYISGGLSICVLFLPRRLLNKLQLSNDTRMYHQLGVHWINQVTQNGAVINRLIRRRYPHYKVVGSTRQAAQLHYRKTYMYERFHYMLFCFFTCITVYALVQQHFTWALVILVTNILYNIYPVLLQQYVRLKLAPFVSREHIK
jgi:hypothetical protein